MKSRRIPATVKFEEDIKPPFASLYGFSTRGRVGRKNVPDTLDAVSALFPDLPKRLGKIDGGRKLRAVNGFTARETRRDRSAAEDRHKPRVDIECALIVWYNQKGHDNAPVAVEFSFRYGNTTGAVERKGRAARLRHVRDDSERPA